MLAKNDIFDVVDVPKNTVAVFVLWHKLSQTTLTNVLKESLFQIVSLHQSLCSFKDFTHYELPLGVYYMQTPVYMLSIILFISVI